jgi:hypothetical protein
MPVNAYRPDPQLIAWYRERQHTETTPFLDEPTVTTVSGVDRREQHAAVVPRVAEFGVQIEDPPNAVAVIVRGGWLRIVAGFACSTEPDLARSRPGQQPGWEGAQGDGGQVTIARRARGSRCAPGS